MDSNSDLVAGHKKQGTIPQKRLLVDPTNSLDILRASSKWLSVSDSTTTWQTGDGFSSLRSMERPEGALDASFMTIQLLCDCLQYGGRDFSHLLL
mmetsp:Transcript_12623/g.24251  ORF Transcript_12623/g.24251 Transcript_12623/m.24251 type:complete len:95 (+) Transcript_12623:443-727(+)|eukprot:scaffold14067_cov172-Amphora_coffeaeformis.AAC.1